MRAGEHQGADIALLVDDDPRFAAGPLEHAVDVARPVPQVEPEYHLAAGVEGARAVRGLPDVNS